MFTYTSGTNGWQYPKPVMTRKLSQAWKYTIETSNTQEIKSSVVTAKVTG